MMLHLSGILPLVPVPTRPAPVPFCPQAHPTSAGPNAAATLNAAGAAQHAAAMPSATERPPSFLSPKQSVAVAFMALGPARGRAAYSYPRAFCGVGLLLCAYSVMA